MSMTTELALLNSKAKASIFTMKYISQFEASDIDSDDVDLRFEVDGVETGTNVSIVDECGQAAQMITALVEALEARDKQIAQQREYYEGVIADGSQRIAELEARTVKLPDYSETYTTGFASEIEHQVRKVLEMAGVAVEGE